MLIAIPYDQQQIYQHFGRSEQFKLYEVVNRKVVFSEILSVDGARHSQMAQLLKQWEVEVVICGGIGPGMMNHLKEQQIEVFGGVVGNCDEAIEDYIEGCLDYDPDIVNNHIGHRHHSMMS